MIKKKITIMILIILSMILVSTPSYAQEKKGYEILVKYKDETKFLSTQSLELKYIDEISKINVKKIKVDTEEEYLELLEKLNTDSNVEYAESNTIYNMMQIPNDTYVYEDWGINCINAPATWDLTVGNSDTIVAVIDTGVELNNLELINQLVEGYDFVNVDSIPEDDNGHGTLVSEVIGAEANNGFCKAGVSWNSKIMPLKALDQNGQGYTDDIAEAIIRATDDGVNIINLSLGGPEVSQTLHDAIQYANNEGVLIIAASGNEEDQSKNDVFYPAAYEEVIAVGAIDENETIADFSCRGIEMSLVAPGVRIIGYRGGEEVLADGTSFSSPYVSGAAALVWSVCPELTNNQVREILESTTRDLGYIGWDEEYGYGVLDVYEAVKKSIEYLYNQGDYASGDFNMNNIIDIYDLVKIARITNTAFDDENYSEVYDINNDKIINLLDLNIQSLNYGKKY